MSDGRTRLPISPPVRDKLRAQKVGGETYDEVILRLIEGNAENEIETPNAQRGVSQQ
jgi:predicted CopG family antitoxin